MTEEEDATVSRRFYCAMALVSCCVLLFEISITRILSAVLWYHFAFLSVSLALLGLGVPGVWFSFNPPSPSALPRALLWAGATVPLSVVVLLLVGQYAAPTPLLVVTVLMLLYAMLSLGTCVCLFLLAAKGRAVGRMYAADLIGASLGALAVVPLLHWLSTPLIVACCGFLPLLACTLTHPSWRSRVLPVASVLLGLVVWQVPFQVRFNKDSPMDRVPLLEESPAYVKWTPMARLTIRRLLPHLRQSARSLPPGGKLPGEYMVLALDGDAGSKIFRLEGSPEDMEHLFYHVASVGYRLRSPTTACVIGAGGGGDILTALKAGVKTVHAVELNSHIIDALTNTYGDYCGRVYERPGVEAVADEGRSFLTRQTVPYDVIQITLIDSWAATAAGAYALSENYLYTEEAFRLYLQRLSPEGFLCISRWMKGIHQLEAPRLCALALSALGLEGFRDPASHCAFVGSGALGTLLVSKTPLTQSDLRDLDEVCRQHEFQRLWPLGPGVRRDTAVAAAFLGRLAVFEKAGFLLSPPSDDSPFFFQMLPVIGGPTATGTRPVSLCNRSVVLLRWLLAGVGGLTLLLFFLPFLRRGGPARGPSFWLGSAYFLSIGLAFMFVEMPWIQRFVLFLGHPSHAMTVVLASLLVGAGLGSACASRLSLAVITRWAPLLPLGALAVNLVLSPLFTSTLGWTFPWRVLLTAGLLTPAGFLMGFAFPTGMVAFGEDGKPWFWAVNGAASVLASVSSLALSMAFGFAAVSLVGVVLYVVASLLLRLRQSRLFGLSS